MADIVRSAERRPSVVHARRPAPDAQQVYASILAAAERQFATTAEARAIIDAGLEQALRSLVQQIAGNAANPIADEIADPLTVTL